MQEISTRFEQLTKYHTEVSSLFGDIPVTLARLMIGEVL